MSDSLSGYRHRSRSGCNTCKAARIKCDEHRPSCQTCSDRNVACQGYAKTLKWVTVPGPASQRAQDVQFNPRRRGWAILNSNQFASHRPDTGQPCGAPRQHRAMILAPRPSRSLTFGFSFNHDGDDSLLRHWMDQIPDLVFPNPKSFKRIRDAQLITMVEPNSILLPMVLAGASAHLCNAGIFPRTEMLVRKQTAIASLLKACSASEGVASESVDALVTAAVNLIGVEVMQGSNLDIILPLIRGAVSLVERRCSLPEDVPWSAFNLPVQASIKMLAWHDTMTCVPFPRQNSLGISYWYSSQFSELPISMEVEPDAMLGYCGTILPLITAAAILIRHYYEHKISESKFCSLQAGLLDRISQAMGILPLPYYISELPAATAPTDSIHSTHNACVNAAISHAVATKIYLLRATDHDYTSPTIIYLVNCLARSVANVQRTSAVITMMLWPLFVLGCESFGNNLKWRQTVIETLQFLFQRTSLLNVSRCEEALVSRIWPLSQAGVVMSDRSHASWLRFCYEEKIQLDLS
ncbi:hypothetical protein CC79DRAFT_194310 [Sarocladium strictum]